MKLVENSLLSSLYRERGRKHDAVAEAVDFIIGNSDLAKLRACRWPTAADFPDSSDAVQIKLKLDDNKDTLTINVVTAQLTW